MARHISCQRPVTTLFAAAVSLVVMGCATGPSEPQSDADTPQKTVGEPPEEAEPTNVSAGRNVSAKTVTADDDSNVSKTGANEKAAQGDGETGKTPGESSSSSSAGNRAGAVDRQALLDIFEKGPAWLLQQVTLQPVREEGKFQGYRIADATKSARHHMTPQLQIGDVITEVNGVALERPDDYLKAWSQLPRTNAVEINYVREGEVQTARWTVVRERDDD